MIADQEGRFIASIIDHSVAETGPNRLVTFVARFELEKEWAASEWVPVGPGTETTGYFYLERRDGGVNQITVDQLVAALGWDGTDLEWLAGDAVREVRMQVTLRDETWNGQVRTKVARIDHVDSTGAPGMAKADAAQIRSMTARFGAKLRASAPPRAGRRAAPAARPALPAAAAPQKAVESTIDLAWDSFVASRGGTLGPAELEVAWNDMLDRMFPDVIDWSELAPSQWGSVVEAIKRPRPTSRRPVAGDEPHQGPQISSDDLPF